MRSPASLHSQSWGGWFTERTQFYRMCRCVILLYGPFGHTSSPKAGKSQSLATQFKQSSGALLSKEASSSPISQPPQRLQVCFDFTLTNAWHNGLQLPLQTFSRMNGVPSRMYLPKMKWTRPLSRASSQCCRLLIMVSCCPEMPR